MKNLFYLMLLVSGLSFGQQTFGEDYIFVSSNVVDSDSQYHFVSGGAFAIPGYFLGLDLYDGNRNKAVWTGVAVGTGANLLKEITDIGKTGFSADDLMWGFAGSVVSSYIMDKLYYPAYQKRKDREKLAIEIMKQKELDGMSDEERLLNSISK